MRGHTEGYLGTTSETRAEAKYSSVLFCLIIRPLNSFFPYILSLQTVVESTLFTHAGREESSLLSSLP